jgi:hypothetical protein
MHSCDLCLRVNRTLICFKDVPTPAVDVGYISHSMYVSETWYYSSRQNIQNARAVYRQPPPHFFAEPLPPQKIGTVLPFFFKPVIQLFNQILLIGNNYLYGMRISPVQFNGPPSPFGSDTASTYTSTSSDSSKSQSGEYTVLRRWDDCLWFQHILEAEYTSQAREKRRRLAQGKGVLKGGVYMRSDLASSFDSLPFGPDPSTITTDIHNIIPKLTKKNTLFRVSQALVEQRYKEFAALVETLFQDDLPILAKELRDSDLVRNFFGYWSFDRDLERQQGRGRSLSVPTPKSSSWSLRFSASTLTQPRTSTPGDLKSVPKHDSNVETSPSRIGYPSPKRRDLSYNDGEQERQSPRIIRLPKSVPSFSILLLALILISAKVLRITTLTGVGVFVTIINHTIRCCFQFLHLLPY